MHHAYLLIGGQDEAEAYVQSVCHTPAGSPDYFARKGGVFGIDEARSLTETAMRKAFTGKKVFFLAPEKITLEAQNALLKTFEEPIADTHFFLVMADEGTIILTLKSRMRTVRLEHVAREEGSEAEKFLKLPLKDRMTYVKKFIDKEKPLSPFLDELLSITRDRRVYEMRLVSDQRGASARMVLEHLAAVL